MSDLREALEKLVGEAWDDGNAVGLDGYVGPNRGAGDLDPEAERRRQQVLDQTATLLAASSHPEEVDPETGFTRPLLDRAAVRDAIRDEFLWAGPAIIEQDVESAVGHVMELARPMPTREQIDELLQLHRVGRAFEPPDPDRPSALQSYRRRLRNALLALLNGTES